MRWSSLGRIGIGAASAFTSWLGTTPVQALEPLDRVQVSGEPCALLGQCADRAARSTGEGLPAIFRCSGH